MKFKVGDKVKVRDDIAVGTLYAGYSFSSPMAKYLGCVATITLADSNMFGKKRYHIDLDGGAAGWTDEMLEPYCGFCKADLKDGMVVEYRSGEKRLVLNGRFMDVRSTGWMPIRDYNDDLTDGTNTKAYDIVKVYSSDSNTIPYYCCDDHLTLIWERKEEPDYKEMTVEEIEEKLGYKVKVIADK